MPRLSEHCEKRPGWFAKLVYAITRRKLGHVPAPVKVLHANTGLLMGVGAFETALERAHRVPDRIKSLAQLRVANRVGCPF
ncbi:MAG: hypothetical protein K0V04_16235 [Deltaproteobacteria bacterium]|nr:hypothetical protein [Deltaproteobacteria bacterium]